MPWFFANANPETANVKSSATQFNPDGSVFPSYLVFRDALSAQILSAQSRVCVLSTQFEDRELGLMLFGVSRRALSIAIRINPRPDMLSGRLGRLADELRSLGLNLSENSLKSLKLKEPTVVAIDQRAWTISASLSETNSGRVEVESAPWTSGEVCQWAHASPSAKAATGR